jgi:hypothetical protein
MLRQVLQELETAGGSISLTELARKLDVEPGALVGMIEFWVRKGRLIDDARVNDAALGSCSTGSCGGSCSGPQGCPFIVKMPQTYTLAPPDKDRRS